MSMLCIVIPTVNQKERLGKAVEYYTKALPNTPIYILDNGKQGLNYDEHKLVSIRVAPYNFGVSESWNHLLYWAYGQNHDYVWVLNDDVIVEIDEAKINATLERYSDADFLVCRPFYNWSSFIIPMQTFFRVGPFDTTFYPCFYEDNDYDYRISLAKLKKVYADDLNPTVYANSQSTLAQPELDNSEKNRKRYITKWGGPPNAEVYKQPYDGQTLDVWVNSL